jgi:TRAP-type C4-dicarboxylate transport system substrate-binding protein
LRSRAAVDAWNWGWPGPPALCHAFGHRGRRQEPTPTHLIDAASRDGDWDMHGRGRFEVHTKRKLLLTTMGMAVGAMVTMASPAYAQAPKTFVMKLSTATINESQHEWLKRFAAAVEKSSGGRIKGEVYPASQLGPIPRQIEGVQFGSIQAWMGPPEFLVGVDTRYEVLSAPGLMNSYDQAVKVLYDPVVQKMMFGLGENKGLEGIGIAPIGPSQIITKKEVKRLADLKGMKLRVLASPFQLELIRRMDASPVAMTLADVLPGIQQGTIDGALAIITVYTTMQYQDAAKYVLETDQPYINSIVVMSKRWLATLPPDLQKIVRDEAAKASKEIVPYVKSFFDKQMETWKARGGVLTKLPAAEHAAMLAKVSTIAQDLSKDKPDLNKAVKLVFEAAARK